LHHVIAFDFIHFSVKIRTEYIAYLQQGTLLQLKCKYNYETVLEFKTLIVLLSMVLIAVSGFKLMCGDAIGQTERTKSEELNATSLPHKVKITISNVILQADVALSSEEQTKGLSIKDSLKSNEGMIFPYESPRTLSFWMKDMKFPIDILWLDADKKVVHIEEGLQPCSPLLPCPSYTPDVQAQYVLETVAGFSSANEITMGTPVEFNLST
jgi:uncharacterized membrane protein (UPF0127 family)